jgi:hypothetical protein
VKLSKICFPKCNNAWPSVRGRRTWRTTKGDGGDDVMMGDLVLMQEEENPVMSALLDHCLEVTALHNHFFWAQPEVFIYERRGLCPCRSV